MCPDSSFPFKEKCVFIWNKEQLLLLCFINDMVTPPTTSPNL